MHAYVEVIRADGRTQVRPLDGEQITVGSGVEAGLSLPDAAELERVHLLLAPRNEGCWVSVAQGAETAAWVAGRKHENGMLPWGAELDVGSITFRINHAVVEEHKRQAQRRRWRLIAMLACAAVAGSWLLDGRGDALPRRPAEPPALFADLPATCPETERDTARARGAADLEAAQARVVRYPFDAHDGVQAVYLFATAAACLDRGGRPDAARGAGEQRDRLRARVEEDYQLELLRLGRALHDRRLADAVVATRALRTLLEHRDGPYRDWLLRVQRHLETKLTGRKS